MKKIGIGRWELVLIVLALGVLIGFMILKDRQGPSGVAHVTVNGEQVLELSLKDSWDQRIDLRVYGVPATLEIQDHKIRFVDVTCPDHICEKTGWIWRDGQTAVCMPNRTSVVIVEN